MLVVKVGGSRDTSYQNLVKDIARKKEKMILVHGGSQELNELQEKLGNPAQTITSPSGFVSRRSTRETIEMFLMAYCGKINKVLVEALQKEGVNAVGLSGVDGKLFQGKRRESIRSVENGKTKIIRDDFSGKTDKVNTEILNLLLDNGYFPVLTPPAISYSNDIINTDGDVAAALVAREMKADVLIILSDVPGLLKDVSDSESLIINIPKNEIDDYMEFAKGRMKKKLLGAKEALKNGVKKVIFASANSKNPISSALEGKGTVIE